MKKTTLLVTTAFLTIAPAAIAQDEKLITPDETFLFEKDYMPEREKEARLLKMNEDFMSR